MSKEERGQSLVPHPRKQCVDPKGNVVLSEIGPVYRVVFTLNDEVLENKCRYGGYRRTYWVSLADAESMYDEHLDWLKKALVSK